MGLFLYRLRSLISRNSKERELQEELEFHLRQEVEEQMEAGATEAHAQRAARRELGNRTLIEEDTRAAWGWTWIERLGHDASYAARMVRRRPGFAISAVLTLALGVGGNTAALSLLDALLLRTLPVPRSHQLVRLVEPGSESGALRDAFTLADYDALSAATKTLSGITASSQMLNRPTEIEERGEKRSISIQFVSTNYFDVLGVRPPLGRAFHLSDATSSEPMAVISEEHWRRHHAGESSVLGRRFLHQGREFTIAGVAPAGFRGTDIDVPVDVWVPVEQIVPPGSPDRIRGRWIRIMGRLHPDAATSDAEAESTAILGRPVTFEPGATGYSSLRRRLSQPLSIVALLGALVLLIACVNLANLMLAGTASRAREISVRAALGASRPRVVRQLVTESLLLAAAGGALALAVAHWVSGVLLGFLPPEHDPALTHLRFQLDARAFTFAAVLSVGTCIIFGLFPALRATSGHPATAFRVNSGSEQRNKGWLNRGLLVTQVVMCTALLTVAVVCLRSLHNLRGQDAGYDEASLVVADVQLPREFPQHRRDQLLEDLRQRAASLPNVHVAAFSHVGQLSGAAIEYGVRVIGAAAPGNAPFDVVEHRVSPGFLTAMGTALLSGRDVAPSDDQRSRPVAIVNESFARAYLSGHHPIGARFSRITRSAVGEPIEIIGVVRDSKWLNLRDEFRPMYYRPYSQQGGSPMVRFAIRTTAEPETLAVQLHQIVRAEVPQLALSNVVPFREIVNRTMVTERLTAYVSTALGALALLIASVGLYGVLAYSVARRRREIGVRVAMGASPGAVEWMIVRESMAVLLCGMAIGLPVALMVTRLLSSTLFGLSPHDPGSVATALAVLALATAAAAYAPARRAASGDPVVALRED